MRRSVLFTKGSQRVKVKAAGGQRQAELIRGGYKRAGSVEGS
jgi:hypothetical protein